MTLGERKGGQTPRVIGPGGPLVTCRSGCWSSATTAATPLVFTALHLVRLGLWTWHSPTSGL